MSFIIFKIIIIINVHDTSSISLDFRHLEVLEKLGFGVLGFKNLFFLTYFDQKHLINALRTLINQYFNSKHI